MWMKIVLTDNRGAIPFAKKPLAPAPRALEISREVQLDADFLHLPLVRRDDGPKPGLERLVIDADDKLLRYMHVEFPAQGQTPDFWYSTDLRELRGRAVKLRYRSHDAAFWIDFSSATNRLSIPRATYPSIVPASTSAHDWVG